MSPPQAPQQSVEGELADLRQRVAAASPRGFKAVEALLVALDVASQADEPEGSRAAKLAVEAFLPWCMDAHYGDRAASLAAAFAKRFGERVLVAGGDPARALEVLDRVWLHRQRAGYRAVELALTFADACRLAGRYADAEGALAFAGALLDAAPSLRLDDDEQSMLPVHRVGLDCRRATLELSLGNPDGALPYLRRAARVVAAQRPKSSDPVPAVLARAWRDAALLLCREQVDCYLGLEHFAAALRAAEQGDAEDLLLDFYRAIARSWVAADVGARAVAEADLVQWARQGNPAQRRKALVRLVEWSAESGDLAAASRFLEGLQTDDTAPRDPLGTTLATELLLQRDAQQPVPRAELVRQQAAQLAAFESMARAWAATPRRDDGVGFLHFLFRRDTIGQLIAITLRAAAPDAGIAGEPAAGAAAAGGTAADRAAAEPAHPAVSPSRRDDPERAAAVAASLVHVMTTQVLGTLPRHLGTVVPTVADLQALLRPDHGIVLFLPARTRTHVFAVTADGVEHHELSVGAVALRDGVERFVTLLQAATGELEIDAARATALADELRLCGRDLTNSLFPAPLRARMRAWRRLTVIGSELLHGSVSGSPDAGYLNHVPIECLPWDESALFGQRFALDHNVSLPVWTQLARRVRRFDAASQVRVFGVLQAEAAGGAAADPGDLLGDSLAPWCEPFPRSAQYVDAACTMRAVVGEHADIAVFLAHGGYDAGSPRGSFLQLFDGRLCCDDAQRLGSATERFARFVVLAACRAAKAPTRAGDSLANLGGAMLLGGADAVAQSRFDLPLHRTRALLEHALRRLRAGDSVAEALRAARAASVASDPLDAYRTGVLQVHGCGQAPK